MVEVSNELIYTLMLEIQREQNAFQAGQEAIRDELSNLNDSMRAMARSQVAMQRDLKALNDRVTALTVASAGDDGDPRTHA
jgi:predicted  nucleic acid-binding Zn-ribbon protein